METEENKNSTDMEKLKEIPKWSKKYAQNRTLTNLAGMIIFLILFIGIAAPSYFAGMAWKNENFVLAYVCFALSIVFIICLFIFSIPKFGNKIMKRIEERIYHSEGTASIPEPKLMKNKKWIGQIVGLVFGGCVICSVFLGERYIPIEYMQPVAAIYVVPFLVFLYLWQRPKISPLMLIWPVFFAIHAILIVTGVPIVFSKESGLVSLNMYIPTFGYGFITFGISHIYSRYAMKKLKNITHLEGDAVDGD